MFDASRLLQLCSKEDAYAVANDIIHGDSQVDSFSPDYIAPLEVGNTRPWDSDLPPRDDTAYQWYVDVKVDVKVPIGEYKGCYRLLLFTLGSSTIRYVCPGVGLVAKEYQHPPQVDFRAELASMSSTAHQDTEAGPLQLPVPAVYMLNHDEARGLLIEAGWTPSMHHWAYYEDRPYLQSTVFYEKGYSELADCSGTGYGFCTLLFHDAYSNTLVVTTQGDQAKVVDSRVVPDE